MTRFPGRSPCINRRIVESSDKQMPQPAKLALEDGTVFTGNAFGAIGEVSGEAVFNTSMTGYQEILTDPSYRGQILTMTYPQIGNYGVNKEDMESAKIHMAGFIVREASRTISNFRAEGSLDEFLKKNNIVGMSDIDTRALVRRLRSRGAMKAILSSIDLDEDSLIEKARRSPGLVGRDLVQEVLPDQQKLWDEDLSPWVKMGDRNRALTSRSEQDLHVVALDYGMKWNIPRHLRDLGCRVTVLPGTASPEEVLSHEPDGIFLSNGPGDPEPLHKPIETIQGLLGKKPIFGICLGHQLLSLACGAKTFKLKFGHRGANQPVLDLETDKVEITSQNHGFAVEEDTLPECLEITHRNLNDNTIAGVKHKELDAFSVQYHPEASAGPHDSEYLFNRFRQVMDQQRNAATQ